MTRESDIQAVIFDVGGVLDTPDRRAEEDSDRRRLAAQLGLDVDEMWRRFYQTETWKLARIGQITDGEFWNRNLSPFGITNLRLAIISNASDTLEITLEKRFQIAHYFEIVVNSARVGYAKPEPAIFRIALERLALRPAQTVFTDDQQHNVDAARESGLHAVLFTAAHDLRKHLVELGVLRD
jgi:HAD superfamily hydrolase (TIGR01509 family)